MEIEPSEEVALVEALAWIYTRSDDVMLELWKLRPRAGGEFVGPEQVNAAIARLNSQLEEKVEPFAHSLEGCWPLLRDAVAQRRMVLRGVRFEKGHRVNKLGVFDAPFEYERDVSPGAPPQNIEPEVVASLVLDITSNQLRLRPSRAWSGGGWWWRHVEVDLGDLTREFKHEQRNALSPLEKRIIEICTNLNKTGEYPSKTKELFNRVEDALGRGNVSESAFKRALRKHKESTGVSLSPRDRNRT